MNYISLYIAYHDKKPEADSEIIIPIDSGRTDGINIALHKDYCELRAQYWIWKNGRRSEYVGFFHPRRYLSPTGLVRLPTDIRPIPYEIQSAPDEGAYKTNSLIELINGMDAIAPVKEYTGISVRQRYSISHRQRGRDIELARDIIREKYPEFEDSAEEYLNGSGEYYGNIYIMKWDFFERYCSWLFDILFEFDNRAANPLPQTNGLLGERLFGIYFTWLQKQENVQCGELPRVFFSAYDDERHSFKLRGLINSIIPPGSEQRAVMNRIKYKLNSLKQRNRIDNKQS